MAVTQVALDNEGGGAAAFEAIKEADPDGGTVLVVGHEPGISTNEARIKGFLDALGEDPAFTALPTQYAQNPGRGRRIVTSTLQATPDLIDIFAHKAFRRGRCGDRSVVFTDTAGEASDPASILVPVTDKRPLQPIETGVGLGGCNWGHATP